MPFARLLILTFFAVQLSGCVLMQPGPPSLRTIYDRGDLVVVFQGIHPGPSANLRLNDLVRVELSYKSLTGKPFRIWAMPYKATGGYAKGVCFEPSKEITEREGVLERYITGCQTPNGPVTQVEPVTEVRIKVVTPDQSITFYEGIISNVNYNFSN
jgi:hypothetical protein